MAALREGDGQMMFTRITAAWRDWRGRGQSTRSLQTGDVVLPHEVLGMYSECVAEDGRVLRLYDLVQGRTGAQAFHPGEKPGAITVAD